MKILLKISGEAFKGDKDFGICVESAKKIALMIKELHEKKQKIVILIGGGNIHRGGNLIKFGINPTDSHNLGMLSTVFNSVVLKNVLEEVGIKSVVIDPIGIKFLEKYNKDIAIKYLNKGNVVICTGGSGNPYFTVDTGGVLRAIELGCDFMIKATKVDGVYSNDPITNPNAIFFDTISYDECISKGLKIIDTTALVLAKENNLKIKVVSFYKKGAILNAVLGKKEGSIIC